MYPEFVFHTKYVLIKVFLLFFKLIGIHLSRCTYPCKSVYCHYFEIISTSCVFLYLAGGVGRRGVSRPQRPGGQPLTQQQRRGVRSQSKESTPPKDLDLVTKRMLSARLLKINELRNSLAELQQRTDELQKENRVLRQVCLTI